MKHDIAQLKAAMDAARTDPAFIPCDGKTYCNLAAHQIATALGLDLFYNKTQKRVMLANEMVAHLEAHPESFSRFYSHGDAARLAALGHLIFAAAKGEAHGHIAPVYPNGEMVTSGKWRAQAPLLSNVGVRNELMGANFAFADPPVYFLVM